MREKILCILILLLSLRADAQWSNLREKKIICTGDTLVLDTLSIVSESLIVKGKNGQIPDSLFYFNPNEALLLIRDCKGDTLLLSYRVFPLRLSQTFQRHDASKLEPDAQGKVNPFSYTANSINTDLFSNDGLNKSGSISRGIALGNNQDLSVNSSLNLELSGKITETIRIDASITDDNIPIQPDGNTQQLQDFDQVYIRVYDDRHSLRAGDFWLPKPKGYFLNYNKRGQGASFSMQRGTSDSTGILETRNSVAISKGKFSRHVFQGIEGNQGPYRLKGAENETFIIVLAGTESVYIDGQLLKRGQEFDYTIDYNTAEITFTPNQLITKDRRIVVEFQYSDKNYARTMLESSTSYTTKKYTAYFNFYSEQDSKNQPILQELSDSAKILFANIGDSLDLAVFPSISEVGYSDNLVLYALRDSLGYDSVFVFSTSPDSAIYKLQFSYVGEGKGNYVQSDFTALGRTFRWVAPDTIGSVIYKQGNYDPVILLISPKRRQMLSAGTEWRFGKYGKALAEGSFTNTDLNTFSSKGNSDNQGFGIKLKYENKHRIGDSAKAMRLITNVNLETISATFKPIERFRAVEFERNWNIQNRTLEGNQYIADAEIGLQKKTFSSTYGLNSFFAGDDYTGILHRLKIIQNGKHLTTDIQASALQTDGLQNTDFIRHKAFIKYAHPLFSIGFRDDHEWNRFYVNNSDSLSKSSYRFYDWQVFASSNEQAPNRFEIYYRERYDWNSDYLSLKNSANARQYGFITDLAKNPKNRLRTNIGYRELRITDSTLTSQKPDQTLVSRLEYDLRLAKNAFVFNTFYEIGTGQELKKEFIYVEVPAGQGIYTWVDYNENGVKELNEFEIAAFPDLATYIRTFTPSNTYIRTYSNEFSQSVQINPALLWRNKKGIKKILAFFSSQTSYRVERKTNQENGADRFNPFVASVSDSSLLTLGSSFRQSLFFNRTNAAFGADYSFQDVQSKSLLTNGFDSRGNQYHQLKLRWNFSPEYSVILGGEKGIKRNASDFLSGRNYRISYTEFIPKFVVQPNAKFRVSFSYRYAEKQNSEELGNEQAVFHDGGLVLKLNIINKGSFQATFNYIQISYSGTVNSSIGFEMLEALKPGRNLTWTATWQQNLAKHLQLNLNYNARKTEGNKTIHSGGVQLRAFF
jgi:hypothetical protein